MKQLLFILCLVALLSAMSVELEQPRMGSIKYTISERGALNSTLYIVVLREGVQHGVLTIEGFNGLYSGEFPIFSQGEYIVNVYNLGTGKTAQAKMMVSAPDAIPAGETSIEEIEQQFAEQAAKIREEPEYMEWVPYFIVALVVLIIAMLLFGNPLKKPREKK